MKVSLLCSRRHLNSAQVFLWEGAGWTLFLEWKNKSTSCFKFALGLVNSLHLSSLMKLTLEYILTSMNIYWPPQKHQEAWKTFLTDLKSVRKITLNQSSQVKTFSGRSVHWQMTPKWTCMVRACMNTTGTGPLLRTDHVTADRWSKICSRFVDTLFSHWKKCIKQYL